MPRGKKTVLGEKRNRFAVGVDLGANRIKAGILNGSGEPVLKKGVVTRTHAKKSATIGLANIVKAVKTTVEEARLSAKDILGVGVGCPGTVDVKHGVMLQPVNFSESWQDFAIGDELSTALSLPVILENDANAFAFGEYSVQEKKPAKMVVLTIGTGLGSGLIVRGKIHTFFEAGHFQIRGRGGRKCSCGKRGCLEAYVSTTALKKRTQELLDSGKETNLRARWDHSRDKMKLVFDLAKEGDRECARLVNSTAGYLVDGCLTIMHVHTPDAIHLTGGIAALGGEEFARRTEKLTRERVLNVLADKTVIRCGNLDPHSGWVGAASLVHARLGNTLRTR